MILVIGDWSRVEAADEREQAIKQRTLELYRRDSRNIKILTFDELYERAKFIVEHKEKSLSTKPMLAASDRSAVVVNGTKEATGFSETVSSKRAIE